MQSKKTIIEYLAKNERMDPQREMMLAARFRDSVAEIFQPVWRDMEARQHNEYWFKGGRGSCKSSFIALSIVRLLQQANNRHALIIRKVGGTLRNSVYPQIQWAMDKLGVADEWECTVSPMEMTNRETGQKILFRGLDEPRKLKSIKPRHGYICATWFEEADELDGMQEAESVMESALRGSSEPCLALFSYNPPKSRGAWVNEESEKIVESRLVHHSCYTQVPASWLGQTFIDRAEEMRRVEPERWRHIYGGEATGDGGAVFANLVERELTVEELDYCRHHTEYGLDFGYSNDPCALMSVAYGESGDGRTTLYIFEEWVKAGAGFDLLEKTIRSRCGQHEVFCDTDPRAIAELHGRRLNISAARKGQKSRAFGMQWLEDLTEIIVDKRRCPVAAEEFRKFEHAKTADGHWRADYQDGDDHTIDAVRYACWRRIHKNRRTKYFSGKGARA